MNFILCLPVVNICFHWLSFHLKLININIFQACSIKNQGLSGTKTQFQVISRPWNKTPEILGFSRVFKMHTNSVYTCNEWNILATRVKWILNTVIIWRLRSGSSLNLHIHVTISFQVSEARTDKADQNISTGKIIETLWIKFNTKASFAVLCRWIKQ